MSIIGSPSCRNVSDLLPAEAAVKVAGFPGVEIERAETGGRCPPFHGADQSRTYASASMRLRDHEAGEPWRQVVGGLQFAADEQNGTDRHAVDAGDEGGLRAVAVEERPQPCRILLQRPCAPPEECVEAQPGDSADVRLAHCFDHGWHRGFSE